MVEALTFIACTQRSTDVLVTVFEENQTADPATALFSIRSSGYVALKHFQYILGKLISYSVIKTSYATHAGYISLVFYHP